MTRLNTQFSVKGISLLNSVMASSSSVQFKKFLFNQVDDIAGMKCPQLSKPEATAARNQNSIGDRTEKKTLGETRLSRWGHFSSGQTTQQFNCNCCKVRLEGSTGSRGLFLMACLGDGGPHWGSVSGAHLGVLVSADIQGCRGRL